jgi:hypothetical protein
MIRAWCPLILVVIQLAAIIITMAVVPMQIMTGLGDTDAVRKVTSLLSGEIKGHVQLTNDVGPPKLIEV